VKPLFDHCPLCQSAQIETIHELDCGNLDKSRLYPVIRIKCCLGCGHIFNALTAEELTGLAYYYNDEYAPANLNTANKTGDFPGSTDSLTTRRYDQLYGTLSHHINVQQEVIDVGCALGGFLDYLNDHGFQRLAGVDMTQTYVEEARRKNKYRIELGNAESLPFPDHTFDVIVMEQVLEHLFNPVQAFQEAARVLKAGGIFCVGVPDASRYSDFYFFDFYWLLLREHIQHFDATHLELLGKREGFELLECRQTIHAVMSEKMVMPNLYAVFRLRGSGLKASEDNAPHLILKQQMEDYIYQEKIKQSLKIRKITKLIESRKPVFVWGIGREFLYIYESTGLKSCHIAGLIDANSYKQKSCSVNEMKICDAGDLLPKAPGNSVLMITAIAHTNAIEAAARSLGYKGEIFELL
jgi:SAM-dependent methyltransferase